MSYATIKAIWPGEKAEDLEAHTQCNNECVIS